MKKIEYHNPERVTAKQLGKQRFLLVGEYPQKGDEVMGAHGNWQRTQNWRNGEAMSAGYTYRTRRPLPRSEELCLSEDEKNVLALFYMNNGDPATLEAKAETLCRFLKAKVCWFGTGGVVTELDKVGMLEEEYLQKIGIQKRA